MSKSSLDVELAANPGSLIWVLGLGSVLPGLNFHIVFRFFLGVGVEVDGIKADCFQLPLPCLIFIINSQVRQCYELLQGRVTCG